MSKRNILSLFFILFVWTQQVKAQCEPSDQKLFKSPNAFFSFDDITFTKTGKLVGTGYGIQGSLKTAVASFSNNNSTISWLKLYNIVNARLVTVAANDDIFIVGNLFSSPSIIALVIMRLDPSGNIKWIKRYQDSFSPDTWLLWRVMPYDILATSDDELVICGSKEYQFPNANNYKFRSFIFKLDANGDLKWSREDTNNWHDEYYAVVEKNGSLYAAGATASGSLQYGTLTKIDPATGNLSFVKGYSLGDVRASYIRMLYSTPYGFLLSAQAYKTETGKNGHYIIKVSDNGNILYEKQMSFNSPSLFNPFYEAAPTTDGGCLVWVNDKNNTLFLKEANLYKLDPQLDPQWKKNYPVPSTFPDAVIMKAWEENGRYKALGVSTDPKLNTQSRFTRLFNINTDGLLTGCITKDAELNIKDSLRFTVADIGYSNTYNMIFQSPFTATVSVGTAAVTDELICNIGCVMTDLKIEGDSLLCNSSEAIIKVSRVGTCPPDIEWIVDPSFADYSRLNDTTIRVQVKLNGVGKIKARWKGPCTMLEKEINIYRSTTNKLVNIGKDTSLCQGKELTLSVSQPWNTITWFNNSTTSQVKVNAAGIYWVKVSDDGVCYYADTMQLLQVHANPVVNLGNKESICLPGPLLLNPGTFAAYEWQDGSANAVLPVYTTGAYWVKVTDNNGCTGSDSVEIKNAVAPPSAFVSFKDSAICVGQQLLLTLKNSFSSYSWNNGASAKAQYSISIPGQYTIEVIDANGCSGKDTITVIDKRCQYLVYFPNAFVPKGANKTFKPVFPGAIPEEYLLRIYNRYGEPVFESTDPFAAWDGTYKGVLQPAGTFVWYCQYMFADKVVKQVKNFVVLIQ